MWPGKERIKKRDERRREDPGKEGAEKMGKRGGVKAFRFISPTLTAVQGYG